MSESLLKSLAPGEARFIAKPIGEGRRVTYEVYDRAMASIPVLRRGYGTVQQDHKTQESAEAEAARLEEYYRGA